MNLIKLSAISFASAFLIWSSPVVAVTELSQQELEETAADTNPPYFLADDAVVSDESLVCADDGVALEPGFTGASMEYAQPQNQIAQDEGEPSSVPVTQSICHADPVKVANDPLNHQQADIFYNNLSGSLDSNRAFIEQNPFSGSALNAPSLDPQSQQTSDEVFRRARELSLQLGESLRNIDTTP